MCSVDRMRRLEEVRDRFHAMALASASLRCSGESYAEVFDLSRLLDEGAAKGIATIIATLGAAEAKAVAVARVGDGVAASDELGAIAHAVRAERIAAGDDDLAVGFPWIEGRIPDQSGGGIEIRAPLFLYPATLSVASSKAGPVWSLSIAGAPWLNEPLAGLFRRFTRVRLTYEDFLAQDEDGLFKADDATWQGFLKTLGRAGVTLADTAATFPTRPERFEAITSETLAKFPAGQFRLRNQVVLGRFPMLAASIAADYDLTLHGVNPAVGVDSYALSGAGPLTEVDYDDPGFYGRAPARDGQDLGLLGPVRRWQIVPGDVWQDEALRTLEVCRDGGVAITGAPGTGRSQVITNAVAAALARGEKVLVTSTRRAALDDVIEHLVERGLGEPLAVVHDPWRDRASLAASLGETLLPFIDSGNMERVDVGPAQKRVKALERAFFARIDNHDKGWDTLAGADQKSPGLADLDERMLADDLLKVLPLEALPDLSDFVEGVAPREVDKALVEMAILAVDAAPYIAPHPLSLRTDWSTMHDKDVVALYRAIAELRRALAAWGALPGPLSPADVERHRGLFAQVRPLVALAMGDSRDALADHAVVRSWLIANGSKRGPSAEQRELIKTLRGEATTLPEVPSELIVLPATELAERVGSLEKLLKIETSGLRALSPSFWSLKKLPEKILAGLPEVLPEGYDKTTEGLLRLHQDAQRWQAVLATVPEAECFALPVLGVPSHLLAVVERCEKVFEEAVAEDHFLRAVGPSFPSPVDWARVPPTAVAQSPFLTGVVQEVARAAAYHAVVKALEPLSGRFADDWYERLVKVARDAPKEAEAMLVPIAATAEDGQRVAALDRATSKLPVFVDRFLRVWSGETRLATAACRRAVEEGWRARRMRAWGGVNPEAALIDPRDLRALGDSLEELMAARAELILAEYKRRVAELDDVDSQRQDLLKLVQETSRKRLRASLKQLVERYWKRGLNTLRPVWFAQLDAIASVFPRERDAFDLVIVDEAQGAGLWRAMPALIRAKRVMIVGDPMQAPPRDDWDYPLLSLARGAFPSASLWWCWGARNEETWVFPNYAAYGGAVLVGPNVERRTRARSEGLHWVRVEGRVEHRANRIEAEKVVDLVHQALSEPLEGDRYPSIGVTAMTREQTELIRERLDRRIQRDPDFRALMEADRARPEMEQLVIGDLFEGPPDTRDIQILSLTSGPSDTSKKIQIEFGKLTRFDGEGFLFGLIARARCGFTMVTSFAEAAIDVQRTQEVGPRLLHAFMVFMRGASLGDERFMEEGLEAAQVVMGLEVKVDAKGDTHKRVGDLARDELIEPLLSRGLGVMEEPPRASVIPFGATRAGRASGPPPGRMKVFPVAPDLALSPTPKGLPRVGLMTSRFLEEPDTLTRDLYARRFWERLGWKLVRVTPGVWRANAEGVVQSLEKLFGLPPRPFVRPGYEVQPEVIESEPEVFESEPEVFESEPEVFQPEPEDAPEAAAVSPSPESSSADELALEDELDPALLAALLSDQAPGPAAAAEKAEVAQPTRVAKAAASKAAAPSVASVQNEEDEIDAAILAALREAERASEAVPAAAVDESIWGASEEVHSFVRPASKTKVAASPLEERLEPLVVETPAESTPEPAPVESGAIAADPVVESTESAPEAQRNHTVVGVPRPKTDQSPRPAESSANAPKVPTVTVPRPAPAAPEPVVSAPVVPAPVVPEPVVSAPVAPAAVVPEPVVSAPVAPEPAVPAPVVPEPVVPAPVVPQPVKAVVPAPGPATSAPSPVPLPPTPVPRPPLPVSGTVPRPPLPTPAVPRPPTTPASSVPRPPATPSSGVVPRPPAAPAPPPKPPLPPRPAIAPTTARPAAGPRRSGPEQASDTAIRQGGEADPANGIPGPPSPPSPPVADEGKGNE